MRAVAVAMLLATFACAPPAPPVPAPSPTAPSPTPPGPTRAPKVDAPAGSGSVPGAVAAPPAGSSTAASTDVQKYGVSFQGVHKRQTVVVGQDGSVRKVYRKVDVTVHAQQVLADLSAAP